jgi:hypothetical protein
MAWPIHCAFVTKTPPWPLKILSFAQVFPARPNAQGGASITVQNVSERCNFCIFFTIFCHFCKFLTIFCNFLRRLARLMRDSSASLGAFNTKILACYVKAGPIPRNFLELFEIFFPDFECPAGKTLPVNLGGFVGIKALFCRLNTLLLSY